jgi:ABC-2 type transport system ATP-binding protein
MSAIVELQGVTKNFGRRTAVDKLDLAIEAGELFGLVGPNGAGKTTTLRMLVTLLRPDHGEVRVAGRSVEDEPQAVKQLIGYMPDVFGLYGNLTVGEYLDFFAACYRIPPAQRKKRIHELLELVGIAHRRDDLVDTLSRGLQQRLALARVQIHDPQLLVLDEPASGLDPRARVEIRQLLKEIAGRGKTIVLSSHILTDIAELCSRVAIMEQGQLVAAGTIEQLTQRLMSSRLIRIALLQGVSATDVQDVLANSAGVSKVQRLMTREDVQRILFELEFRGDDHALHKMLTDLLARNLPVVYFSEVSQNLEDVFLHATRGIVS